jgi:hypothetical protein
LSGEFLENGWATIDTLGMTADAEFGMYCGVARAGASMWKMHPTDTIQDSKLDIETARKYRLEGILGQWTILRVVNYHSMTSTFSGNIVGYTGDGSGITVKIFRDSDGVQIGSTTSTAGGAYSFTWYGDTDSLFASAVQDSTHIGRSVAAAPTY